MFSAIVKNLQVKVFSLRCPMSEKEYKLPSAVVVFKYTLPEK